MMNEHNQNIRVNRNEVNENKLDPIQIAINQTDAILMEIACNLNQIEQDAQKSTLTDEDKANIKQQVDAEHHDVFLSMNAIRGVDIDEFCSDEKGEGDN